jgi:hypothetical protein
MDVYPAPELGEGLVIHHELMLSSDHGFQNIVLDCLSIIQRISLSVRGHSLVGTVISDMKSIASSFGSCSFKFSKRETKVLAYTWLVTLCFQFVI